jgi:hypothetical protein
MKCQTEQERQERLKKILDKYAELSPDGQARVRILLGMLELNEEKVK